MIQHSLSANLKLVLDATASLELVLSLGWLVTLFFKFSELSHYPEYLCNIKMLVHTIVYFVSLVK